MSLRSVSGPFKTGCHLSIQVGCPRLPEATSIQHVAFSRSVVTHHSRKDVPGLPEATSVEYVNGAAQGVLREC